MKIGIVGDYHPDYPSQRATNEALMHACKKAGSRIEYDWIPTASIAERWAGIKEAYAGFWIAPGSPAYVQGVWLVIQHARENDIPLLGTCGGFQNMIIEYARNQLMIEEAGHEEYDPDANQWLINKLSCSLAGRLGEVIIRQHSKVFGIYQTSTVMEHFRCHYGLNADYQTRIDQSGLHIVGADRQGNPRIIELPEHRFFIGTLFVPQLSSTEEQPHCLVTAFIEAAAACWGSGDETGSFTSQINNETRGQSYPYEQGR